MNVFKYGLVLSLAATVTPALAQPKIAEICTGSETIQIGSQSPTTAPYSLTFSADLDARSYCYGPCGREQSYPISDAESKPIKLTDFRRGDQIRLLTFDLQTSKVADYQVFNAGLAMITRRASGVCVASAFHPPFPQTQAAR
jgi:hypothetical protein